MARKKRPLGDWRNAPKRYLRDSADPQVYRMIEAASAGELLEIVYHGGSQPGTSRQIRPEAVYFAVGFGYYVEAYDYRRREDRTFRLDRIRVLGGQAGVQRSVRPRQSQKPQPAPSIVRAARNRSQPPPSKCFIATCVYDSEESWEVLELRRFRDTILNRSTMGRTSIRLYESVGPHLASLIGRNNVAMRLTRLIFSQIVIPFVGLLESFYRKHNSDNY